MILLRDWAVVDDDIGKVCVFVQLVRVIDRQ